MSFSSSGSGVESRLLDLLEYRSILGAVITTPDGLVVANAAVEGPDAEHLAAMSVSVDQPGDDSPRFDEAVSDFGAIHIASGRDLRLIVLTDSGIQRDQLRPTLSEHLVDIENMIRT